MGKDSDGRVLGIRAQLQVVDDIRMRQAESLSLLPRVRALKAFQQERFKETYADLLDSARYDRAAQFFLDELYGPGDFSGRDAQFARVVPALVRLFPEAVVDTVALLSELHGLTESLDDDMSRHQVSDTLSMADYVRAWHAVGRWDARAQQLSMVLDLGKRLDGLTRNRLLRKSLHWMRPAARAAGLEQLQQFLERGFDGFAGMQGSAEFLAIIANREQGFIAKMQNTCDLPFDIKG